MGGGMGSSGCCGVLRFLAGRGVAMASSGGGQERGGAGLATTSTRLLAAEISDALYSATTNSSEAGDSSNSRPCPCRVPHLLISCRHPLLPSYCLCPHFNTTEGLLSHPISPRWHLDLFHRVRPPLLSLISDLLTLPFSHSELSDREFQDTAESTLERLTDYLEDKLEELDVPGSDIEYSVRFSLPLDLSLIKARTDETDLGVRQVGRLDRQAR